MRLNFGNELTFRKAGVRCYRGEALDTLETEEQMIQRVMPDLMGLKNILAINDEAHHCYREKPGVAEEADELTGDDRKEVEKGL